MKLLDIFKEILTNSFPNYPILPHVNEKREELKFKGGNSEFLIYYDENSDPKCRGINAGFAQLSEFKDHDKYLGLYNNSVAEFQLRGLSSRDNSEAIKIVNSGADIEIDSASPTFFSWLFTQPEFKEYIRHRLDIWISSAISQGTPRRVRSVGLFVPTVKTLKIDGSEIDLEKILGKAPTFLCSVSMEMGLAYQLRPSFKQLPLSLGIEKADQLDSPVEIQFPNYAFDEKMVKYYTMAHATIWQSQKYLAFYNVLECKFVSIANDVLVSQLKVLLASPKFSLSDESLSRLISKVKGSSIESDENKMINALLKRYVTFAEMRDYIESFPKGKILKGKISCFGKNFNIGTSDEEGLVASVGAVLKSIRNAIVHSSDRYEGDSRYVPFDRDSDEMIIKAMPLVRYCSEMVLRGTAV